MKKYIQYVILSIYLVTLLSCGNDPIDPEIDYSNLSKYGNWEIVKKDSSLNEGHIKLKNDIWLMHFLHWWPLTDDNSSISPEYIKHLLMHLWGMQFHLTGVEGETKINGHQAFYIEGELGEVVKTRFIVWNCPETKRQFLSDCNINISLKTPDSLLILQTDDITNSVCCHPLEKIVNPRLPQQIAYKDQNIKISLPEKWRSNLYFENSDTTIKTPGHYLNGCTEMQGSIWNLLSESKKEINLIWKKNTNISLKDSRKALLEHYFSDTTFTMHDTLRLFTYCTITDQATSIEYDEYMENSGYFKLITEVENYYPIDTSRFMFRSYFWHQEQTDYLILCSMAAYDNFWGIPFDLTPTEEQFNSFIENTALKNMNALQIISR